jgi:hypothetical protein
VLIFAGCSSIDWAATGAMMGGIGAILAAVFTLGLIFLTRRYVQINEKLYRLNKESLDQLKESVTATKDMAQVMTDEFGLHAAEREDAIRSEYEPFRGLLLQIQAGCHRLLTSDLRESFAIAGSRPNTVDVRPTNFPEITAGAQHVDVGLHAQLMELDAGPLGRLQRAMGQLAHLYRDRGEAPPEEERLGPAVESCSTQWRRDDVCDARRGLIH